MCLEEMAGGEGDRAGGRSFWPSGVRSSGWTAPGEVPVLSGQFDC